MAAGRLAAQGLSRSKIVKELATKYKDLSNKILEDAASQGAKAAKYSEKTGKPIKDFYKEMLPLQTGAKEVARAGIKKGVKYTAVAGAGGAGLAGLVDRIMEESGGGGSASAASSNKRKPSENTKKAVSTEYRGKVMSETKLNKGGVVKANCGASVKPNRMSRS